MPVWCVPRSAIRPVSSHEKALVKLLAKHGYDCDANPFGYRTFTRAGCRPIDLYPSPVKATCERFTRQVTQDMRRLVEPPENDWEAEERKRAEAQKLREAADAARVKKTRLGGAAAVLTEPEIDAVARQAERTMADRRQLERLMRERPLGAPRRTR